MGFGMSVGGPAKVFRPQSVEEVAAAFDDVRRQGASLALRGAGCSYGDASTNRNGHVLDLTSMNNILEKLLENLSPLEKSRKFLRSFSRSLLKRLVVKKSFI